MKEMDADKLGKVSFPEFRHNVEKKVGMTIVREALMNYFA